MFYTLITIKYILQTMLPTMKSEYVETGIEGSRWVFFYRNNINDAEIKHAEATKITLELLTHFNI